MKEPIGQISVIEAADLGSSNFRVRLSVGDGENEIIHSDIISAASRDDAVQKAKEEFARWLKKILELVGNRAA